MRFESPLPDGAGGACTSGAPLLENPSELAHPATPPASLLRSILDALPDPIWVRDSSGRILFANRAHTKGARDAGEQSQGGKVDSGSSHLAREVPLNGGQGWVLCLSNPEPAAPAAVKELRQRLLIQKAILDNIPDPAWLKDIHGRFLAVNAAMARFHGRPGEELLGKTIGELRRAEASAWEAEDRRILEAQQPLRFHERLVSDEGEPRWFETVRAPFRDEAGNILGVVGIALDVTERKRSEERLRRTEDLYRRSIAAAEAVPYCRDHATNRFTYMGEDILMLTGYRASEMTPTLWESRLQECVLRGEAAGLTYTEAVQRARSGGFDYWRCDCLIRHRDGSFRWIADTSVELREGTAASTGSIGMLQDITARITAQNQVREQARLLDLSQDAILVCDLAGRITFWNRGAERLYGRTAKEMLSRSIDTLNSSESLFETVRQHVVAKGEWQSELRQRSTNGRDLWVASRWTLVRARDGQPESILILNTDITEKRSLEAKYLHAQRMEAIGTLASGIAHDLNNILAPVLMLPPLLKRGVRPEETDRLLAMIEASAQRGAAIIRQLLNFGRGDQDEPLTVQLRHLVRDLARMVGETFPKNIVLQLSTSKDLWCIRGNPTQLQQVLLNLLVNARDAMPAGGTLGLTAENRWLDEPTARKLGLAKPGPYVELSVADTGEGIPEANLERIFHPFFTTKPPGQGTGLGLSTTMGIVKAHEGGIQVRSQVARGTVFTLRLPAIPAAESQPAADAPAQPPQGHGELVLVVDDEENIRKATRKALESNGYRVLTATNGSQALEMVAQHRDQIRLTITDLMMPPLDGVGFIRALARLAPEIRIVADTGLTPDNPPPGVPRGLEGLRVHGVLLKPHTPEEMLHLLHRILTDAPAVPPTTPNPTG